MEALFDNAYAFAVNLDTKAVLVSCLVAVIPLGLLLALLVIAVRSILFPKISRGCIAFFHPFANDGGE